MHGYLVHLIAQMIIFIRQLCHKANLLKSYIAKCFSSTWTNLVKMVKTKSILLVQRLVQGHHAENILPQKVLIHHGAIAVNFQEVVHSKYHL